MSTHHHLHSINTRISVRSYSDRELEPGIIESINELLASRTTGPFGTPLRFRLMDLAGSDILKVKGAGTYGMIKGGRYYIGGAVTSGPLAMIDFGYVFESIILDLVAMGLGTCWMAGTFQRSDFQELFSLSENEILAAVSPVGYEIEEKRLKIKIVRTLLGVRKRKKFEDIFRVMKTGQGLSEAESGPWKQVLESVQQGPSASNKQPWRIIRDDDEFHFFMDEDLAYNTALAPVKPQDMDLGIAMCHFERSAGALGLSGRLEILNPAPVYAYKPWRYTASWKTLA